MSNLGFFCYINFKYLLEGSERWERRLHAVLNRAGEIYGKKCSFFDPNVPNGGPRPTLEYRKRRDIEDSDLRYSSTDGESSIKGYFKILYEEIKIKLWNSCGCSNLLMWLSVEATRCLGEFVV